MITKVTLLFSYTRTLYVEKTLVYTKTQNQYHMLDDCGGEVVYIG